MTQFKTLVVKTKLPDEIQTQSKTLLVKTKLPDEIQTQKQELFLKSAFYRVHSHIEWSKQEILAKLEKKNPIKKKQIKMIERDPVDLNFLIEILQTKRKKREKHLCFSRFRIAVCLLFLTGARVNEIRELDVKQIYGLLETRTIVINQSKTFSLRKVVLGTKSIKLLKSLELDIDTVFSEHETLSGGSTPIAWIKFINQRLKTIAKQHQVNSHISSHSFRIGFVTKLLKNIPIHLVKDLVNHKSIQTTMKYSRHRLSDRERANSIDMLLLPDDSEKEKKK